MGLNRAKQWADCYWIQQLRTDFRALFTAAEHNDGKLRLGIGQARSFDSGFQILPKINHLGGLIQYFNAISFGNPVLAFNSFKLFKCASAVYVPEEQEVK